MDGWNELHAPYGLPDISYLRYMLHIDIGHYLQSLPVPKVE